MSVRKVTGNKGGKTSGIDKMLWTTNKQKYRAVMDLKVKGYKPMPTLFLYALQPIAETTGDRCSFGFRKYRSCADAMEQLFVTLSPKRSGQWILEGDIKGRFDNINHQWMIENTPMDKAMLNKFLKAGYIYRKQLFPTTRGAIQGGTISPTLANLTLDGLEHEIARHYFLTKKGKISYHSRNNPNQIHMVRYVYDFVVTANNKETLEQIADIISGFLKTRGLELSREKTAITHISEGFDFLGWNFRKYEGKLIIKPSTKSLNKVTKKISEIMHRNRTVKQEYLIYQMNQVLKGCNSI